MDITTNEEDSYLVESGQWWDKGVVKGRVKIFGWCGIPWGNPDNKHLKMFEFLEIISRFRISFKRTQ